MHTSSVVTQIPRGSSRFPTSPRWGGQPPPTDWSLQRTRAIGALRSWESASRDGKAPDPAECMGGTELIAYAIRQKAHPFPLRRPAGPQLRDMRLRDRHLTELAWVVAVELAFKREALLITHADMGALVGCSERTAGEDMRHLASLGLVVALPMFVRGGVGHAQLACSYRVSALALEVFRIRPRSSATASAGRNCQPTETPLTRDPELVESPIGESLSGTETETGAAISPQSPRVQTRAPAPQAPDGTGIDEHQVRGAPQLARRLLRDLGKFEAAIERELRGTYRATQRAQQAALAARYERASSAPPPELRLPLDLRDLHPDDAAWIAAREPGAGAVLPRAAPVDDFDDVIARAGASWTARNGDA